MCKVSSFHSQACGQHECPQTMPDDDAGRRQRHTNHDSVGLLVFMPNEPKTVVSHEFIHLMIVEFPICPCCTTRSQYSYQTL